VPRLDEPRKAQLHPIDGQPPDLTRLPPGCAFAPRCPYAIPRCQHESPPLLRLSNGHLSACWVADQLGTEAPL
jgi:oligopeptide/dipeptide ABC transporter ATP-binding protein